MHLGGIGGVGGGGAAVHGAPPVAAHDLTLQQAATKVANRGLGDKLVGWLRNKGIVTTPSPTMQAVRAAITTKVGAGSAQAIFDSLNMGAGRSLSDRKITTAINLANRIEAGQGTPIGQAFANLPAPSASTTPDSRFAKALIGVEKAMAASGQDRGTLNDAELVAIWDYSADGYQQTNDALRAGNPGNDIVAVRDTLNQALAKLPNHVGDVYRCVNLPDDVLSTYTKNAVVTDAGFASTSRAEDEAKMFPSNHTMYINVTGGKDISGFSRSPGEQEVLMPAGTQYRILDRQNEVSLSFGYGGQTQKAHFTMQQV